MREIFRSQTCVEDLRGIWLHLTENSRAAADLFVQELDDRLEVLCRFPFMGENRSSLAPDLLSFSFEHAVVFYTQDLEGIKIARIFLSPRDGRPELPGRN